MKSGRKTVITGVILILTLAACKDVMHNDSDISPDLIGKWELTSFVTSSGTVYTIPCKYSSSEINSGGYEFGEDTLTHYLNGEIQRKLRNLYTEEDKLFAANASTTTKDTELGSWVVEGDKLSIFPGASPSNSNPNPNAPPVRPTEENIFVRVSKFSWE
ncbi:MAG: hypothetical protein LBC57_07015 [Treponema sp.]|jgi:hypothetical protein|nr:hypothetical protein [Treponema sp.]